MLISLIQWWGSLSNNMMWWTGSKVFCKSINTAQTYCLLSSDSSRSSISLITAWAVETFFENQTVAGVKYYVHLEISWLFCV